MLTNSLVPRSGRDLQATETPASKYTRLCDVSLKLLYKERVLKHIKQHKTEIPNFSLYSRGNGVEKQKTQCGIMAYTLIIV